MHSVWPLSATLIALMLRLAAPNIASTVRELDASRGPIGRAPTPAIVGEPNERLLALEPFVGRWTADGELAGGRRYTAEREYAWSLDKRYLRIDHRMTIDSVEIAEQMMIGWDPNAETLRLWSFASDGSFAEGTEREAPGENRWIFEGTTVGATATTWRITTFLSDPTSFSMLVEIRTDGDFAAVMTVPYRKVE